MNRTELDQRLSRISTQWTMVFRAHGGQGDALELARRTLLERYSGAVFRYLVAAVRDADAAEDLAQEFALRFLRGDFRRAQPSKGRFRNYLKTALIHLVTDYHRSRLASPRPISPDVASPPSPEEDETTFVASWREELLARTWQALEKHNSTYKAALELRIQEPELSSGQLAEKLSVQLAKPISAALVRKALQRAHEKFADLMLDEVAASLDTTTPDELEQELRELDLLRYCRAALARRK
ncbi:MAG: sigma-70 family RNA polymerase sigma factor [Planctomycetes bacterium]|nr:sigma-70 family RNA polymerase sigma factor [Planctomycetota bacterium]